MTAQKPSAAKSLAHSSGGGGGGEEIMHVLRNDHNAESYHVLLADVAIVCNDVVCCRHPNISRLRPRACIDPCIICLKPRIDMCGDHYKPFFG